MYRFGFHFRDSTKENDKTCVRVHRKADSYDMNKCNKSERLVISDSIAPTEKERERLRKNGD